MPDLAMPSKAIDQVWHRMLDSREAYERFSIGACGRVVEHRSSCGAGLVAWVAEYERRFGKLDPIWFTDEMSVLDATAYDRIAHLTTAINANCHRPMTGIDTGAHETGRGPVSFRDGTPFSCSWYSSALAVRFCPYLNAAERSQLLYEYEYRLATADRMAVEEGIFYQGVVHTEAFRLKRRGMGARERVLLCDNLVLSPAHRSANWQGR